MDKEEVPRPTPGLIKLLDAGMWGTHIRELSDFMAAATERADNPPGRDDASAVSLVNAQIPSLRANGLYTDELSRSAAEQNAPFEDAVILGLAIGAEEIERGWRDPPPKVKGKVRTWWESKRPRYADRRTLEALAKMSRDEVEDSGGFTLCSYFVLLGYWASFEPY